MEISLDAKTWKQRIDLDEAEEVFAEAQGSRDTALGETGAGVTKTTENVTIKDSSGTDILVVEYGEGWKVTN